MVTTADVRLVSDIKNILLNGMKDVSPRPRYSDGTPAHTYFVNHVVRQYDLHREFPICTLRPIAWKSAIREILWIYQDASNDLGLLHDKYHINYWDEWESKDLPGTIGQRYGATVKKYDSMNRLLKDIKEDPYGRHHIISLWQEEDFTESDGLMPCAFLTIWNVWGEFLDMMLIQRSGDMLAASGAGGINEVQYAALQIMVAKATGYKPGKFTHVIANEQIYDRHLEAAITLLDRFEQSKPESFNPQAFLHVDCKFSPKDNDFWKFSCDDFELVGYDPVKPQLKLDMGI